MAVTYNFSIAQGTDSTVPFLLSDSNGTTIDLTDFEQQLIDVCNSVASGGTATQQLSSEEN